MSPQPTAAQTAKGWRLLPFHWSYILLAAFLVFFAWKYLEKTREVQGLARQEAALRLANRQIENNNIQTQRSINQFHKLSYVEDQARSQLDYTLPGEAPVIVSAHVARHPEFRAAPPRPAAPPAPTWRQWWTTFFG